MAVSVIAVTMAACMITVAAQVFTNNRLKNESLKRIVNK